MMIDYKIIFKKLPLNVEILENPSQVRQRDQQKVRMLHSLTFHALT